jgi:agmatine/peptidylarginine deiminase
MAEWEEVDYLLLTWTQHEPVLREIIRYARQECQVLIICMDADGVKQDLQAHGIPREGIDFLEHPFNSVWMRDYGPSTVYLNGVDSLVLVDWIYNRPRPIDDHLSRAIADHLGLPLLRMDTAPQDLVHIGGNFITDGNGTAFSSRLILAENGPQARYNQTPRDEGSIDTLMRRYLGIDRYLKLTPLPHDPIDHLDMHMKLLDEQRLLVGQYPTGVADGPQIEANLTYLQSALPQPYELIRVPMPAFHGHYPDTGHAPYLTYTNAVFVNRTLLVPTYDLPSDSLALDRYQKALPGYRVVGINCRPLIMAGGALHCVTRTIGTTAPLRIVHRPLADQEVDGLPQQVSASIDHRSGIKRAHLYYRLLGDSTFTPVPMIRVDDRSHQWVGYLPATYEPTTVSYYIEATAYSGKHQTRPMTAPAGYWQVQLTSPYDPPFPQRFSTSEPTW